MVWYSWWPASRLTIYLSVFPDSSMCKLAARSNCCVPSHSGQWEIRCSQCPNSIHANQNTARYGNCLVLCVDGMMIPTAITIAMREKHDKWVLWISNLSLKASRMVYSAPIMPKLCVIITLTSVLLDFVSGPLRTLRRQTLAVGRHRNLRRTRFENRYRFDSERYNCPKDLVCL